MLINTPFRRTLKVNNNSEMNEVEDYGGPADDDKGSQSGQKSQDSGSGGGSGDSGQFGEFENTGTGTWWPSGT